MMSERGGAERVIGVVLTVPFGTDYRSAMAATESANAAAAEAEALGVRRAVEQSAWVAVQAVDSKRTQWQSFAQALAAQTTASNRTRRAWELERPLGRIPLTLRNLRQTRLGEAQARIDALQASALVRIDAHALWHSKEAHADALNESRLLGNAPLSNAPFAPRFLITHLALPAGAALIISSLLMDGGGDFWVADHLYRLQGSRWALRDAG